MRDRVFITCGSNDVWRLQKLWCIFLAGVQHAAFTKSNRWLRDQFCSWDTFVAVAWAAAVQSLRKSKTSVLFSLISTKQISLPAPSLHLSWWYWRHISLWTQNFLQRRLPVEFLLPLKTSSTWNYLCKTPWLPMFYTESYLAELINEVLCNQQV